MNGLNRRHPLPLRYRIRNNERKMNFFDKRFNSENFMLRKLQADRIETKSTDFFG